MNVRLRIKVLISIFMLGILFVSCATTPSIHAWRPYTRVLGSADIIGANRNLNVQVVGDTEPFIGSDQVLTSEIEQLVRQLLQRRGLQITIEPEVLRLELSYLTEKKEFVSNDLLIGTGSKYSSIAGSSTAAGYGAGVGVLLAQMVSGTQQSNSTVISNRSDLVTSYRHTLAVEIKDGDKVMWQSDATWISSTPNIQSELPTALQVMFSNLPNTSDLPVVVPEVKPEREDTFYELYCKNNWYTCPALPYRIRFPQSSGNSTSSNVTVSNFVEGSQAFSAFIDLLQTAEYALPKGSKNYSDPMSSSLWAKAQLGGRYKLGENGKEVLLIIDLVGESAGYVVKNCSIVTESEYSDHLHLMSEWQDALRSYFDIYN